MRPGQRTTPECLGPVAPVSSLKGFNEAGAENYPGIYDGSIRGKRQWLALQ